MHIADSKVYVLSIGVCVLCCLLWFSTGGCDVQQPTGSTEEAKREQVRTDAGSVDTMPERSSVVSKAASFAIDNITQLVPNPAFPKEVKTQKSNNNLDVFDWNGRLYLAFRTAPSHFASEDTRMYIVSTTDGKTWSFETTIHLKTDVREPRFFLWKQDLYLYFAKLGAKRQSFEPGAMWRTKRLADGKWEAPEEVFRNGLIPWRFRVLEGKPVMIGYTGGENIYKFNGKPLKVYLYTTNDGVTWVPFDEKRPVVLEGGVSEVDIAVDGRGDLYAVGRNEAGDKDGFGSKICRAPKGDLANWTCRSDRKKYDSPLLFPHNGEVYLVGRKNVSETGDYDLQSDDDSLTHAQKATQYQLDYWQRPKRCAIWLVRRETLTVEHIKDLPSRGDTCFPSILQRKDNTFELFNYSSDINGDDLSWFAGQNNPTFIYSMRLTLTP